MVATLAGGTASYLAGWVIENVSYDGIFIVAAILFLCLFLNNFMLIADMQKYKQ